MDIVNERGLIECGREEWAGRRKKKEKMKLDNCNTINIKKKFTLDD